MPVFHRAGEAFERAVVDGESVLKRLFGRDCMCGLALRVQEGEFFLDEDDGDEGGVAWTGWTEWTKWTEEAGRVFRCFVGPMRGTFSGLA